MIDWEPAIRKAEDIMKSVLPVSVEEVRAFRISLALAASENAKDLESNLRKIKPLPEKWRWE